MSSKKSASANQLSPSAQNELIETLKKRFQANVKRHPNITWASVEARLRANSHLLPILHAMEETGGEPDVVSLDAKSGVVRFFDCSAESPSGRRSVCFDAQALASRKENKPKTSAQELAATVGIELLSEEDYRFLQTLGTFDAKTSSWIQTPTEVRALGGALFCDFRFGRVFTYCNGAESYYAARGFRGSLQV